MNFISVEFFACFLLLVIVYYIFPKWQKWILTLASLAFLCTFHIAAVFIVLASTAITLYGYKIKIRADRIIAVHVLLIMLSHSIGLETNALIGVAFYTLQNIAYTVDVKNNPSLQNINPLVYFLNIIYFPKLPSGPIAENTSLTIELEGYKTFKQENLIIGCNRIIYGLFKKLVLSERLSYPISAIFDYPEIHSGFTVSTAVILYTFRVYLDFSAYTDIAIGLSKILGIELPENFHLPLRSKSITEYWQKNHITLMTWLRKYIFYPLSYQLRSQGKWAVMIALLVTFIISAYWHGLKITFLIWGLLHAVYMMLESQIKMPSFIPKFIKNILVLLLLSFAFLFFRSSSLHNATFILKQIFSVHFIPENWLSDYIAILAGGGYFEQQLSLSITVLLVVGTMLLERTLETRSRSAQFNILFWLALSTLIVVFGKFGDQNPFIYLQF